VNYLQFLALRKIGATAIPHPSPFASNGNMTMLRATALLAFVATLTVACNKQAATQPNYAGAINAYYQTHPACLWAGEKKFPVQAATSDDAKTQGYDALVDAGLLTRTTSEKKIIIISKQENNYDLSANGRAAWTADPSQPGFGNFCYGHFEVSSLSQSGPVASGSSSQPSSSSGPSLDQPGATVTVSYVPHLASVPAWASAAETQTAFPAVRAAVSATNSISATLTNTSNGWQVSSVNPPPSNSATSADSKLVQ
jgi:hypothetical protein